MKMNMNIIEKKELYETLNFVKKCNIDMFFLYRISRDIYTFEVLNHTRKHISEDADGNLTHTFLKVRDINKNKHQNVFVEYVVGVDSEVRSKLNEEEVFVKKIGNIYRVNILKAEKFRVDLTSLCEYDLYHCFNNGDIGSIIKSMNKTIYDPNLKRVLETIESFK